MQVKLATLDDLPVLALLISDWFKAYKLDTDYNITFDSSKVEEMLHQWLELPNEISIVLMLLDDEYEVRGILVGNVNIPWFTTDYVATEMIWYVDPSLKSPTGANRLFKIFEEWAQRVGCKFMQSGSFNLLSSGKLDKFYTKRGFTKVEQSYLKEVEAQ